MAGVARIFLDLAAQGPDEVLYLFDIARVGMPPDFQEQLLRRDRMMRVMCQSLKQPLFCRRYVYLTAGDRDFMLVKVDNKVVTAHKMGRRQSLSRSCNHRPYPRSQFGK